MSNNLIQTELDMAEEHILTCLFGDIHSPKVNTFVETFLAMRGKSLVGTINEYLVKFETLIKPILKENGYVDGAKFSNLMKVKFNKDITIQDFRLIELTRALEPMLMNIKSLIQ